MRGGGDELLARRLELGELPLHVVERDGQLTELVGRVDRDRVLEIAGGDLLGGALQSLDPLGERPRDEIPADQREQQRDPSGDQDLVADDRDVAHDVGDRRRVDDHRADAALVGDRIGGLGHGAARRGLGAGGQLALLDRPVREREGQDARSVTCVPSRPGLRAAVPPGACGDEQQRDAVA